MNQKFVPSPEAPLDLNNLGQLVGGDKEKFCKFLRMFVETSPDIISEILSACEAQSLDEMTELAHKFKCSASNISAYELADVCQSLEDAGKSTQWSDINHLVARLDGLFLQISNFVDSYCKPE